MGACFLDHNAIQDEVVVEKFKMDIIQEVFLFRVRYHLMTRSPLERRWQSRSELVYFGARCPVS